MRWTFVCLTGNIQPVSFSVSETVVSASKHYCQANVWWKHTDFPSPCQPHGSFFADSLFDTRSRPGKPARVQGAAQVSETGKIRAIFHGSQINGSMLWFFKWLARARIFWQLIFTPKTRKENESGNFSDKFSDFTIRPQCMWVSCLSCVDLPCNYSAPVFKCKAGLETFRKRCRWVLLLERWAGKLLLRLYGAKRAARHHQSARRP